MILLVPLLVILGVIELAVRGLLALPLGFWVLAGEENDVGEFFRHFLSPYALRLTSYLVIGRYGPRHDPELVRRLEHELLDLE